VMEFLEVTADLVDKIIWVLRSEELCVLLDSLNVEIGSPLLGSNFVLALLSFLLIAAAGTRYHIAILALSAGPMSLKLGELLLLLGNSLSLVLGIDSCFALSEFRLDTSKSLNRAIGNPCASLYLCHCRSVLRVELKH